MHGTKAFAGSVLAMPLAIKIGAEFGGDAPSVAAQIRMTAAAVGAATPTEMRAVKDTGPTAATVAVEVSGPPTTQTRTPTSVTISQVVTCNDSMMASMSSGSPSRVNTSPAPIAKKIVAPTITYREAAPLTKPYHPEIDFGRYFHPSIIAIQLINAGIHMMIDKLFTAVGQSF